jgi:menaquinone-dependent protoporphyrinogen oxidase
MQPILVAYGTTEGQTRKIAEFIAERVRIRGHRVDLVDTATPAARQVAPVYQAAIVGGSLHQHRHQRSLEHFLRDNRVWLAALPLGMFSVSLAAALDDADSRREARRLLDELADDSGLKPCSVRCIAGALKYTQYDYLKRQLMRMIARHHDRSADTSSDVEYTDWGDVERFVDEFLEAAGAAGSARAAA